jgi:predicted DNA-binding protein
MVKKQINVKETISISLPIGLIEYVRNLADADQVSVSYVVRCAIESYKRELEEA